MSRFILFLIGLFFLLAALLLLWWLGPAGATVQRQLRLPAPTATPKDLSLLLQLLFAGGLIPVLGFLLDRLSTAVAGFVIGARESAKEPIRPLLVSGLTGYLVGGLLFSVLVLAFVNQSTAFEQLLAPEWLKVILTWPYHLAALLELFGLPQESYF